MAEINFFWDPVSDNILQERSEGGVVTAEYTHESELYGQLLSENRSGIESQYHFDAQGNAIALTDGNQGVTDGFAYTAFGEVTERTGSTVNPFQFFGSMGYYVNPVTDDLEARARPFKPTIARWMSGDPLGVEAFTNLYCFAQNNPTRLSDPSGLLAWKETPGDEHKFSKGECGKYAWYINWDLSETVDKFPDGYIIQKVEFAFRVKDCCDKTVPLEGGCNPKVANERLGLYKHVYYEVWRVKGGKIYLDVQADPPTMLAEPYHDLFAWKGMDSSKGCLTQYGKAIFVTDLRGVAGLKPAGVESAGKLFSTCNLENNVQIETLAGQRFRKGKVATRAIEVEWNCCPSDAKFKDKSTSVEKGEDKTRDNRCSESIR